MGTTRIADDAIGYAMRRVASCERALTRDARTLANNRNLYHEPRLAAAIEHRRADLDFARSELAKVHRSAA